MCHFRAPLRVYPNDTPNCAELLRGSKILQTFFIYPFDLPGFAVGISHINHDRGGPGKRKETAKGNNEG